MYDLHKPLQGIRSRIVRLLGLKHHVILVLFSGQLRPLVTDFSFLLGLIIIQVISLGLHHQYLSTVEHHDDIRVGVNGPVNLEAQSGNIPVPPLDVAQLRQCPHHLELVHGYKNLQNVSLDEILPHRSEDIQQDARFGADTAMLDAVLLENGVPGVDRSGHTVHGERECSRHYIGDLGVRVVVQCSHRTLFKRVFHAHQAIGIGQHPADDPRACGLGQSVRMKDPALFLFRQIHIRFLLSCFWQSHFFHYKRPEPL